MAAVPNPINFGRAIYGKAADFLDPVFRDPTAFAAPIGAGARGFGDDLARLGARTWGDDAARGAATIPRAAADDIARAAPSTPPRAPLGWKPIAATGAGIGLIAAGAGGGAALFRLGDGAADANVLRNTPIDTNGDGIPDSLPRNPNEGPNWESFFGGIGSGVGQVATTAGPWILLGVAAYLAINNSKEAKKA